MAGSWSFPKGCCDCCGTKEFTVWDVEDGSWTQGTPADEKTATTTGRLVSPRVSANHSLSVTVNTPSASTVTTANWVNTYAVAYIDENNYAFSRQTISVAHVSVPGNHVTIRYESGYMIDGVETVLDDTTEVEANQSDFAIATGRICWDNVNERIIVYRETSFDTDSFYLQKLSAPAGFTAKVTAETANKVALIVDSLGDESSVQFTTTIRLYKETDCSCDCESCQGDMPTGYKLTLSGVAAGIAADACSNWNDLNDPAGFTLTRTGDCFFENVTETCTSPNYTTHSFSFAIGQGAVSITYHLTPSILQAVTWGITISVDDCNVIDCGATFVFTGLTGFGTLIDFSGATATVEPV